MKIRSLGVGTQLWLGIAFILVLVVAMGITTLLTMRKMWENTEILYNHPLVVRHALAEIEVDISNMHHLMKDLLRAKTPSEQQKAILKINSFETQANRQVQVLFDRYLGPMSDVEDLQKDLAQWKTISDETYRMLRWNKHAEAEKRTVENGVGWLQTRKILADIHKIEEFATGKEKELYQKFVSYDSTMYNHKFALICAIIVFSIGAGYLLIKGIKKPLNELIAITEEYCHGNFSVRCEYDSDNELGLLSSAFNRMADRLSRRQWLLECQLKLGDSIQGDKEFGNQADGIIACLCDCVGSPLGALFVMREGRLRLTGRYAYCEHELVPEEFAPGDGVVGQAAAQGTSLLLDDVPDDYILVGSALGQKKPKNILALPYFFENELIGVIELASFNGFTDIQQEFLNTSTLVIGIAIRSALAKQELEELMNETQQQSEELQTQQEELRVSNEELEEQTRRLQESEKKLQSQQEELRVSNEELEEKNEILQSQKFELESSRKIVEEKAQQLALASKYKSEFLSNMSHELRTPLNSLLLLAQGLLRNNDGNLTEEQLESMKIIYGSGSDLLNLINEILDLSKIEAGRMDIIPGDVFISDLVASVRNSFDPQAKDKGISLEVIVSDDAPEKIYTDNKRLMQIIRNLISNAVKFTDEGYVKVTFGRPPEGYVLKKDDVTVADCIAISVEDSGIGITEEQQKIIFEAFQQADGGTARQYGGTGLGLSISRELSKLLGGEIKVSSQQGKGSAFTFYLPVEFQADPVDISVPPEKDNDEGREKVDPPEGSVPQHISDDRDDIKKSDRVVLIIEDDVAFSKILREKCRSKDFKCLAAPDGESGIELAKRYVPQGIILDINLPGIDGWSVLTSLKNDIHTRHIPIHVVSAEEKSNKAFTKGAIGHTEKPIDEEQLELVLSKLEQSSNENPRRVLVVEDNQEMRRQTINLIKTDNVEVDGAATGEEAMKALRSNHYDCVILDIWLPDINGFEILTVLKNEGMVLPPVIVHTAKDLTSKEEETLREHAESIVIKGVRSQERLLDEVTLFLHQVVQQMPETKRNIILNLHNTDSFLLGKKVLVVDDDMRTTFAVSRLLSEHGMVPLKAENGERALKLLDENNDVALVLTDIMMPVMDGYETIRQIRQRPEFSDLPIIALTAKAMPEDRAKCLAAGANDYMPKPVDEERFISMIRVWLYR